MSNIPIIPYKMGGGGVTILRASDFFVPALKGSVPRITIFHWGISLKSFMPRDSFLIRHGGSGHLVDGGNTFL